MKSVPNFTCTRVFSRYAHIGGSLLGATDCTNLDCDFGCRIQARLMIRRDDGKTSHKATCWIGCAKNWVVSK